MNRVALLGLGVVAVVGFGLGWAFLGQPTPVPAGSSPPAAPTPAAADTPARTHTFALLPADIRADPKKYLNVRVSLF